MKKKFLSIIINTLFPLISLCQVTDSIKPRSAYFQKDFSLLTGFNQGKYSFAEIGVAWNEYGGYHHPASFDYFISSEIKIAPKIIIGPKIGVWIAGGFAFGASMIYYTDFDDGSLVFRPEAGIGIAKCKLVYGYNAKLINKNFNGINSHTLGMVYCFMIKKLTIK